MQVNNIKILSYNSFFGARLLAYFLSGCTERKIKYELIFLVLPIISQEKARSILKTANNKSTLQTMFLNKVEGNISTANLNKKLSYFSQLTHTSLIVAANDFGVTVDEYLYISAPLSYKLELNNYMKEYYRSAFYLGYILSNNNYFDTFIKLGIRNI